MASTVVIHELPAALSDAILQTWKTHELMEMWSESITAKSQRSNALRDFKRIAVFTYVCAWVSTVKEQSRSLFFSTMWLSGIELMWVPRLGDKNPYLLSHLTGMEGEGFNRR